MGRRPLARGRILAAVIAAALCRVALGAAADPPPRRVLAIHAYEPGVPADAIFTTGLMGALPLGTELAVYSEHLDRNRFPDPSYEDGFRTWVRTKYANAPPDVIVAIGPDAIAFLGDPAKSLFPGVPVVFGLAPETTVDVARLPSHFTGVVDHIAIRETLELARTLTPDLRVVALVGGASAQDRPLNELLRRDAVAAAGGLEVVDLIGLSMAETQRRLHALPPGSAVFVLSFLEDGEGRRWTGPRCVPAFASISSAPIYTYFTHLLGIGTIGGVQTDFGDSGKAVAGVVLRLLAGERPDAIPVRRSGANHVVLDARELDRWRVPAARVPAGAELRFREPSPWVRYRGEIVLAAVGFLLQSTLIGLLLFERRRRWRAEAKARGNLAVLAHMNRVSTVGELVGSLAHEINSPLGAALNNAEAAQRLMASRPRDEAELRSCLEDIVRDVTRAGEVLRRIRGVLRREPRAPVEVDLATVIRDALHLVKADARDRGVVVEVQLDAPLPPVTGDEVQLAQVILNLLVNALDAVAGIPESSRRVRIDAERRGDRVAIRIVDSGPGVPPLAAACVFEPFFTTKTFGLGMGLSISRSIVEAHGGSIAVSNAPGGGASFEVVLPIAHRGAAAGRSATLG